MNPTEQRHLEEENKILKTENRRLQRVVDALLRIIKKTRIEAVFKNGV